MKVSATLFVIAAASFTVIAAAVLSWAVTGNEAIYQIVRFHYSHVIAVAMGLSIAGLVMHTLGISGIV